jgi:hypothetical protein
MTPEIKTQLTSFTHTFLAVMGAAIAANIDSLDFNNFSKAMFLSFGIAVLRQAIKSLWNFYFPPVVG